MFKPITPAQQTAYDNKRADDCSDVERYCPNCGNVLSEYFGEFLCEDESGCGWSEES